MPVSPLIKVFIGFSLCYRNEKYKWACGFEVPFLPVRSFPAMQRSVLASSMATERTVSAHYTGKMEKLRCSAACV